MAAGLVIGKGSYYGLPQAIRSFNSNATLEQSDLVNVEAAQLEVAGTGDFIAGQVLQDATSASTGVLVDITLGLVVVMDNDNTGTAFAATHVGGYFDIAGATGAQIVDTSTVNQTYTALAGQLSCLEFNPQGIRLDLDADDSVGLFMVNPNEKQF